MNGVIYQVFGKMKIEDDFDWLVKNVISRMQISGKILKRLLWKHNSYYDRLPAFVSVS